MPDSKDISSPELIKEKGSYHPINQMKDSLENLLVSFGFEIVEGPEIETEEFNFDMLNIKESHPARQMHDTFYVNNKSNVLRTHTSPVQIRGMLEKSHHWHLSQVVKFIEKMTMLHICLCSTKLKEYMLMKG